VSQWLNIFIAYSIGTIALINLVIIVPLLVLLEIYFLLSSQISSIGFTLNKCNVLLSISIFKNQTLSLPLDNLCFRVRNKGCGPPFACHNHGFESFGHIKNVKKSLEDDGLQYQIGLH
jgi:hypothetical protein